MVSPRIKGMLFIAAGVALWVGLLFWMTNVAGTGQDLTSIMWAGSCMAPGGLVLVIIGIFTVWLGGSSSSASSGSAPRPVTVSTPKPVTISRPKQETSPVPPLNSQISGHKEERSVDVSQKSKERAIVYCNEGKRLLEQYSGREALRAFDEALKYDAFLLDALIGKMQSHAVLGEDKQSLGTAKRVLSLDQNSREAWRCIATISWERRNKERAWDAVNRLLSNDPKDGSALIIKSALLEEDGRIREALAVVNRAAEEDPNDELLTEYRDALQQRIHDEHVEKTVDSIKFVGGIAANVGKMIAQDVFLPNCVKCGAKLAPGEKICHLCGRPR